MPNSAKINGHYIKRGYSEKKLQLLRYARGKILNIFFAYIYIYIERERERERERWLGV